MSGPISYLLLRRTRQTASLAQETLGAPRRGRARGRDTLEEAVESLRSADFRHTDLPMIGARSSTLPEPPDRAFQAMTQLPMAVVRSSVEDHDRLQERLDGDFLLVPDVKLDIGLPRGIASSERRTRLSQTMKAWPEISGVRRAREQGLDGSGVLLGVLDTGVDADHREFRRRHIDYLYTPLSKQKHEARRVRGFDPGGHGTHVCGIAAGATVGVAPGVELAVASVIESETLETSLSRIVLGLDWFIGLVARPENETKPAILNLSLGFRPEWVGAGDAAATIALMQELFEVLDEYDILPVCAVGNDGPGVTRIPASFAKPLAVGAVDEQLVPAAFSGGGVPGKPDGVGFGVDVWSSIERTSHNKSLYASMHGTSMAAPYVAGVAALVAQAHGLQGQALKARLLADTHPVHYPVDRVGNGLFRVK